MKLPTNYDGKIDIGMTIALFLMFLLMVICVFGVIVTPIDIFYKSPIASQKANEYCKSIGFDQYKEFQRIGFLSDKPVAIKCEYAERYTDLGVRANNN